MSSANAEPRDRPVIEKTPMAPLFNVDGEPLNYMKRSTELVWHFLGEPRRGAIVAEEKSIAKLEAKLKLQLPDDYKQFVKTFGLCVIGQFIYIRVPVVADRHKTFDYAFVSDFADMFQQLVEIEGLPGFVPRVKGGLLPMGVCIGQDLNICWSNTHLSPEEWGIVVFGRDVFEEFALGLAEFLRLLLARKIRSRALSMFLAKHDYEDFATFEQSPDRARAGNVRRRG